MKKKKGFTLVELLAVIVILAVILVIAVPKIMDTIQNAREATFMSSAKLIATQAEKKYSEQMIFDNEEDIMSCDDITKLTEDNYIDCSVRIVDGKAKVTLKGTGKFEGMNVCNSTKDNITLEDNCDDVCITERVEKKYSIKDYDACIENFGDFLGPDANIFCTGNGVEGMTFNQAAIVLPIASGLTETELVGKDVFEIKKVNVCVTEVQDEACFEFNSGVITGYNYSCGGDVIIPEKIDNVTVTAIGEGSFASASEADAFNLKSIKLPDTLTTIGRAGFAGNYSMSEITIPSGVTSIGEEAFIFTPLLKTIYNYTGRSFDWGLIVNADSDSDLTFIEGTVPDKIIGGTKEVLSKQCFTVSSGAITGYDSTCKSDVTIPSEISGQTITTIKENAFKDANITSIFIPSTITTIEKNAFYKDNTSNPNLTKINNMSGKSFNWGLIVNGRSGYEFEAGTVVNSKGNVTVANVQDESCFAFDSGAITGYDRSCGVHVSIPSTIGGVAVTSIGGVAFTTCGAEVANLSNNNRYSASPLINTTYSVNVMPMAQLCESIGIRSVKMPNTIEVIEWGAFSGNSISGVLDLSELTNLTSIDLSAFESNQITSVILPSSVTEVGQKAFYNNPLKKVIVGNTNLTFGECAFGNTINFDSTSVLPNTYPDGYCQK